MNYQKIYDQIIDQAKLENRKRGKDVYYEAHHITPVCMGGEGRLTQWRTHPNLVLLTAREHFIVHQLLCEITHNTRDYYLHCGQCVIKIQQVAGIG